MRLPYRVREALFYLAFVGALVSVGAAVWFGLDAVFTLRDVVPAAYRPVVDKAILAIVFGAVADFLKWVMEQLG